MTEKWKTLSYSQMGSYNTCAKKYEYEYVDRLRLKKGAVQTSSLGDLVHNGIAAALKEQYELQEHPSGLALDQRRVKLQNAAYIAIKARANASKHDMLVLDGDELPPVEDAWDDLAQDAYAITCNVLDELQLGRKYLVADVEQWEYNDADGERIFRSPLVEFYISTFLTDNARFSGVVDAVLYDVERQENILFDWKVRGRFTGYDVEVLNGQLALYQYVLNIAYDLEVTSSVLFQITAKAPQEPKVLKNGKAMSRAAIVSTWEIYKQALLDNGFDPEEYADEMEPKLASVQFFSPVEITRVQATTQRFWDNAIVFAETIEKQTAFPMALGYPCRTCQFARLCAAKMLGYGKEEALENYEPRPDDFSLEEE